MNYKNIERNKEYWIQDDRKKVIYNFVFTKEIDNSVIIPYLDQEFKGLHWQDIEDFDTADFKEKCPEKEDYTTFDFFTKENIFEYIFAIIIDAGLGNSNTEEGINSIKISVDRSPVTLYVKVNEDLRTARMIIYSMNGMYAIDITPGSITDIDHFTFIFCDLTGMSQNITNIPFDEEPLSLEELEIIE